MPFNGRTYILTTTSEANSSCVIMKNMVLKQGNGSGAESQDYSKRRFGCGRARRDGEVVVAVRHDEHRLLARSTQAPRRLQPRSVVALDVPPRHDADRPQTQRLGSTMAVGGRRGGGAHAQRLEDTMAEPRPRRDGHEEEKHANTHSG